MVGRAVETMVWSKVARNIPIISAPRITRIRRCSAGEISSLSISAAPAAFGVVSSSVTMTDLDVLLDGPGEQLQQPAELLPVDRRPLRQQLLQPRPPGREQPLDRTPAVLG